MKGRLFVDGKLRAAQPGRLSAFVETSADTSHPNQTCVGEGFIASLWAGIKPAPTLCKRYCHVGGGVHPPSLKTRRDKSPPGPFLEGSG
jgi:hypothetical protein